MTLSALNEELNLAAPGHWIEFHRGFLAADRVADPELGKLARSINKRHRKGEVGLAQRKHGVFDYSYYVITR
jgi:hypothetical protein